MPCCAVALGLPFAFAGDGRAEPGATPRLPPVDVAAVEPLPA